jgi:predicted GIY-YIG superfamily endonuclease
MSERYSYFNYGIPLNFQKAIRDHRFQTESLKPTKRPQNKAIYIGTSSRPFYRLHKEHMGNHRSNRYIKLYGSTGMRMAWPIQRHNYSIRRDAEANEKRLALRYRNMGYHVIRH